MPVESKEELMWQERVITLMEQVQSVPRFLYFLLALVIVAALPMRIGLGYFFGHLFYHETNYIIYEMPKPDPLETKEQRFLMARAGSYFAYARLYNPNANLGQRNMRYEFVFKSADGAELGRVGGTSYILPLQDKIVMTPVQSFSAPPATVEFSVPDPRWSKTGEIKNLTFSVEGKRWSTDSNNHFFFSAQLKNENPYIISEAEVTVILYNLNHEVIGVNTTALNVLRPDESRYFALVWPNGVDGKVGDAEVKIGINQLDRRTLSTENASLDTYDPRR